MVRPKPSLPPASSILALADAHGRVAIRVSPGAFSDAIALSSSKAGAVLIVRTTIPPEDGKANEAVLRLLAKALDRPVSALELVRGVRTRTKLVRILR
jgi:uncharacterized protein YggU (UPF0235/DUF167 family)